MAQPFTYDPAQTGMRAGQVVRIGSPSPDGSIAHYGPGNKFLYRTPGPKSAMEQGMEYEQAEADFRAGRARANPGAYAPAAPVMSAPAAPASPYQTPDREANIAAAKKDGVFDAKRAAFNSANGEMEMGEAGNIKQRRSPFFGMGQPGGAQASGPNISTAPTGLPKGSMGYARKGGGYTVELADGTKRDFASEAEAMAAFATPATPALPSLPSSTPTSGVAQRTGASPVADNLAPFYTVKGIGQRAGQAAAFAATDQTAANPLNFIDTAERYGTAALGAVWDGSWNVPEKGLVRQGVEAIQERNPFVQNVGSAIGDAMAQRRKREAIATGRIAPDFDARAEAARQKYARPTPFVTPAGKPIPATMMPMRPPARGPNQAPTRPATPAPRPATMSLPAPASVTAPVFKTAIDAAALRTTSPAAQFQMGLKRQSKPGVFSPFALGYDYAGTRLMA